MSKENIILRETVNPPLTTKGSQLLFGELDANFVTMYNEFVALSQSSNVPAYSNLIEYNQNEYVSHNSQTWKMINAVPQIDVTPGTDPLTWVAVYPTEMVVPPNPLAAGLLKKEVSISSAEILALPTLIELIPSPGIGKYINLRQALHNIDFNSAFYEGFNSLQIGFTSVLGGGGDGLWTMDQALRAETTQIREFERIYPAFGSFDTYIRPQDSISLTTVGGGAPILGDSDIKINLTYEILDL